MRKGEGRVETEPGAGEVVLADGVEAGGGQTGGGVDPVRAGGDVV